MEFLLSYFESLFTSLPAVSVVGRQFYTLPIFFFLVKAIIHELLKYPFLTFYLLFAVWCFAYD